MSIDELEKRAEEITWTDDAKKWVMVDFLLQTFGLDLCGSSDRVSIIDSSGYLIGLKMATEELAHLTSWIGTLEDVANALFGRIEFFFRWQSNSKTWEKIDNIFLGCKTLDEAFIRQDLQAGGKKLDWTKIDGKEYGLH